MQLNQWIKRLPHNTDLPLPFYATAQSAGMDICAAVEQELVLLPREKALVPSGIAMALSPGYEAQVRSRSGLAAKHGVVVLNAPGTIDADYRGELKILLINHGTEPYTITRGMRIAQLVVAAVTQVAWQEVNELPEANSTRQEGGFGSTGLEVKIA